MRTPDARALETTMNDDAAPAGPTDGATEEDLDRIAIARYRKEWGKGPFETADCVAFWRDEVLLIKRKNRPQKGRWATPGGFLDQDEPPYVSAIRELVEETVFKLTGEHAGKQIAGLLATAVVGTFRQEGEDRDPRAHINTTVTVLDLDLIEGLEKPEVQAEDDADDAKWTKLRDVPPVMYADHRDIVAKAARIAGRAFA